MKFLNFWLMVVFLNCTIIYAQNSVSTDNTLIKYYSALLSLNLNHAQSEAKIIYHFSKELSFNKEVLRNEIKKIRYNVDQANIDIANIVINVIDSKKLEIDKSLKTIDEHLAQAVVDLNQISDKLNNDKNVSSLLSDIYYQIDSAENEGHQELRKTLNLKSSEDPLLVIPEKL